TAATIIWGITMQAPISAGAQILDCLVRILPTSGSIAALANWKSISTSANSSRGRLRPSIAILVVRERVLSLFGIAPCARSELTSSARMRVIATIAGIANATVTRNTARLENRYPQVPIPTAATPLPIDAKRALRPSRLLIADWPTRPRLMAAIAGPNTQLLADWSTAADRTTGKIGHAA